MGRIELLTVEERYYIQERGLILVPDFPVPNDWQNFEDVSLIVRPDGEQFEAVAQFNMAHFNIRNPQVTIEQRWRIVVMLLSTDQDQVPIGSKLLVRPEVRDTINGPH